MATAASTGHAVTPEALEIHAAKMRLREAGRRLQRIRRLPKTEYVDKVIYETELSNFWEEVTKDRLFLKSKGITRWPNDTPAPSSENPPSR